MARLILFHAVLGVTPGVVAFADALRERGHEVYTPDLFDGRTFDDIPAGLAHVERIGFDTLPARAEAACASLPGEAFYAGMSLGAIAAEHLLMNRADARGALLLHSFVDPSFLSGTWPDGVPVQVYGMERDTFLVDEGDLEAAHEWQRSHPNLEIHLTPGSAHLFTDNSTAEYDAEATAGVLERIDAVLRAS